MQNPGAVLQWVAALHTREMLLWRDSMLLSVLWHWLCIHHKKGSGTSQKWTPTWFPWNVLTAWRGSKAAWMLPDKAVPWHMAIPVPQSPALFHDGHSPCCGLGPHQGVAAHRLPWQCFGASTEQLLWAWTSWCWGQELGEGKTGVGI